MIDALRRALATCDPARLTERAILERGSWTTPSALAGSLLIVAMGKVSVGMLDGARRAFVTASKTLPSTVSAPLRGRAVLVLPRGDFEAGRANEVIRSWEASLEAIALEVIPAEHPVPGPGSKRAAERLLAHCTALGPKDRALFLVSGGTSSLVESSLVSNDPREVAAFYRALVGSGLDIQSMNALRKVTSAVKGGRLAAAAAPARVSTFVVSDVPLGDLSAVGSGPTVDDEDSEARVRDLLSAAGDSTLPPFPNAYDAWFQRPSCPRLPTHLPHVDPAVCLVDNRTLLEAFAEELSREDSRRVVIVLDEGPELDVHAERERMIARAEQARVDAPHRPVIVLAGGEVSVPLPDSVGVGGRNQMFVLECLERIAGTDLCVWSAATDGSDGNSPVAGARADGRSLDRARELGLDPRGSARRFDAYPFFRALGDTLELPVGGHNVRDVRVLSHG